MSVRVTISRELTRNLNRLPQRLQDQLKGAVIETALVHIETRAKQRCRVDTGRLRSSINTRYSNVNATYSYRDDAGNSYQGGLRESPVDMSTKFQCVVGTNVEYASKMERTAPYLKPAYLRARPKLKKALKRIIQNYRP